MKSLAAELPGRFAEYSWCSIFKSLSTGIPWRHQTSSSKRQISQTYPQTLSENPILNACIPQWGTFEDTVIKSALSNNLQLATGYWKLLPIETSVKTTKKEDAWDYLGWGQPLQAKSYSLLHLPGSFCFFFFKYFSAGERRGLRKSPHQLHSEGKRKILFGSYV